MTKLVSMQWIWDFFWYFCRSLVNWFNLTIRSRDVRGLCIQLGPGKAFLEPRECSNKENGRGQISPTDIDVVKCQFDWEKTSDPKLDLRAFASEKSWLWNLLQEKIKLET